MPHWVNPCESIRRSKDLRISESWLRLPLGRRKLKVRHMQELIFEVTQEGDGGYCAECLTEAIVTEGDTWEELRQNVKEAVKAFYFDRPNDVPSTLRLHLVRDEVLAYA
jgi:predicted RNase H-like HicB family nuclease